MIFRVFAQYPVGADAHIGPLESYKSTAFLSVRNPQLFCKLVEAQAEDLGHALLLHGDAVEYVGGLHGAAAVGDDDELGLVAERVQIICEAFDISVVQCGVDLVEHTERCGAYL